MARGYTALPGKMESLETALTTTANYFTMPAFCDLLTGTIDTQLQELLMTRCWAHEFNNCDDLDRDVTLTYPDQLVTLIETRVRTTTCVGQTSPEASGDCILNKLTKRVHGCDIPSGPTSLH